MLIYIVRHGLTEWNKLKKLQGAAAVSYTHLTLPTIA